MAEGRLYIGTKRYSSWSMRGWLAVHLAALDVEEVLIPLAGGETAAVKRVSPNGLVPYLEHRGARVWETIAICHYCAEFAPALWPEDRAVRAEAYAVAAQMHGGFADLRRAMPMNLGRDFAGRGRLPGALADIAAITALWTRTRGRHGGNGPYLFGAAFTAADAMYAPVCARFLTYRPELDAASWAYVQAVRAHPLVDRWYREARSEPEAWLLPKYENDSPPG
jgi:glutathione S-transferase